MKKEELEQTVKNIGKYMKNMNHHSSVQAKSMQSIEKALIGGFAKSNGKLDTVIIVLKWVIIPLISVVGALAGAKIGGLI